MNLILEFRKDRPDIAGYEAERLLLPSEKAACRNIMAVQTAAPGLAGRLGFARSYAEYLFHCNVSELSAKFQKFDWENTIRGSFRVRLWGKGAGERELAGIVWKKLRSPAVSLEHPVTPVDIFVAAGKAFAGIGRKLLSGTFSPRKPHKRPFMRPYSLPPELARCMVNLTGVRHGTLTDPFCGTGGILIEAGLMGIRARGLDIDKAAVEGCSINLAGHGMQDVQVVQADSTKLNESLDYVATDLPYMVNTKGSKENFKRLFSSFLGVMGRHLVHSAVIGVPGGDYSSYFRKTGLLQARHFDIRIHTSMSKRIIVVERRRSRNRQDKGKNHYKIKIKSKKI